GIMRDFARQGLAGFGNETVAIRNPSVPQSRNCLAHEPFTLVLPLFFEKLNLSPIIKLPEVSEIR
ncbi:MAG TPA: hypothetical protein DHU55_18080, partial [Blastocatellia bacterium]|nr:hypothetical protein [Blastocatellia bacterium]